MYGIYIVAFGLLAVAIAATAFRRGDRWAWRALLVGNTVAFASAMTYDRIVGAIGPFEWSEYLGLSVIYGSLAVTVPALTGARAVRGIGYCKQGKHPPTRLGIIGDGGLHLPKKIERGAGIAHFEKSLSPVQTSPQQVRRHIQSRHGLQRFLG